MNKKYKKRIKNIKNTCFLLIICFFVNKIVNIIWILHWWLCYCVGSKFTNLFIKGEFNDIKCF